MAHAAEGTLQAYLDGEIDSAAAVAVHDHVVECVACAGELDALRRANERVSEALGLLDSSAAAPMLRAQFRVEQERRSNRRGTAARVGAWSLAKAAMLVLFLAGAAAAAIPDVRRAIGTTIVRVGEMIGVIDERVAVEPVEEAAAPTEVPVAGMTVVAPSDGRIRVVLNAPTGTIEVVVRLIDEPRARVETSMAEGTVRRRAGSGRLELMDLSTGSVTIGIPRNVPSAEVEVDGAVVVRKAGDQLQSLGPAGDARGSEVRFTIDS